MRKLPVYQRRVKAAIEKQRAAMYQETLGHLSFRDRRELAEGNLDRDTMKALRDTSVAEATALLVYDPLAYVRFGLTINDKAPACVIERLIRDDDPAVRFAALQNPNALPSVAESLSTDPDRQVRKLAKLVVSLRTQQTPHKLLTGKP